MFYMKSIKRMLVITLSLVLLLSNAVFANNLAEMTHEERIEWADKNIKAEYREGIRENSEEDSIGTKSVTSGWIYTEKESNYIMNQVQVIGALETKARWKCDDNQNVVDYNVEIFNAYKYVTFGTMHKYSSINEMAPNNIRMVFDADFVDVTGRHVLTHQYNLHGHGDYSFRAY